MLLKAPGKLLLFGEYAVLLGGDALATPVHQFGGNLIFEPPIGDLSKAQGRLLELTNDQTLKRLDWLNLDRLRHDLSNGMWIQSDIPSGYGLGSSGMVTALIYANYADQNHESLEALKGRLASIESFFHGSSSGIDPLTIFLQKHLLISDKGNKISMIDQLPKHQTHLYLLDSNRKRNTAKLVEAFQQRRDSEHEFDKDFTEMYCASAEALDAYLTESPDFIRHLNQLSDKQLALFDAQFIPTDIAEIWKSGLADKSYTMKLCGAGGGGFFQVWSTHALGDAIGAFPLIEIG